jgi:hypothetical protein
MIDVPQCHADLLTRCEFSQGGVESPTVGQPSQGVLVGLLFEACEQFGDPGLSHLEVTVGSFQEGDRNSFQRPESRWQRFRSHLWPRFHEGATHADLSDFSCKAIESGSVPSALAPYHVGAAPIAIYHIKYGCPVSMPSGICQAHFHTLETSKSNFLHQQGTP